MKVMRSVPPRPRERFVVSSPGEHSKRPHTPAEVAAPGRQRARTHRPCEAAVARLSRREREVLSLLAIRYSDREIADALCISYRTVTTHVTNILNKLGVDSRRQAAATFNSDDER